MNTNGPSLSDRGPEDAETAQLAPGGLLFDAVLTPHRSLSPEGFFWLMAVLAGISLAVGLAFVSMGAWPVIGFFGLDVGLVWLAFRANYRAGTALEAVRLTPAALTVRRVDPRGRESRWEAAPPNWIRVKIDDPPQHHSQLIIASHGRETVVGAFLTPQERGELAAALRAALGRLGRLQ